MNGPRATRTGRRRRCIFAAPLMGLLAVLLAAAGCGSPVGTATPARPVPAAAAPPPLATAPPAMPPPAGSPRGHRLVTPTPSWPPRAAPLTEAEAIANAAALLPPEIAARSRASVERAADGVLWTVRFDGLRAAMDELGWPGAPREPDLPRPTMPIAHVTIEIDVPTEQPRTARAFAADGAAERPQPRADSRWVLPPDKAIILLPPGSWIRTREIVPDPDNHPSVFYIRPLGVEELRGWGFTVVRTAAEFERAAAGARVLWLHPAAIPAVDAAWLRARYEAGIEVGLLDGTMAELGDALGLPLDRPGALQPGEPWPIMAYANRRVCPPGSVRAGRYGGGGSEWLYFSWLLGISGRAIEAERFCDEPLPTPPSAATATRPKGTPARP